MRPELDCRPRGRVGAMKSGAGGRADHTEGRAM